MCCCLLHLLCFVCCFLLFFFQSYGDHRDLHSFLHDALPICPGGSSAPGLRRNGVTDLLQQQPHFSKQRSEEHTSELQSHHDLVCRLLLEKKKARHFGAPAVPAVIQCFGDTNETVAVVARYGW